ncbi:hypothetical protein CALVIDRAFT_569597 [Calocera viscosa TUFC12733]|uniref:Uncharacterized protein n=1 Tax=Calocera viscosa (strain TUFC12733) TaxID=1330018 RepID=A0A167FTL2_CALVF|nr:hypothetical protein CALVIDRAFT_569597 [Calocera viscosa TUFC12733]
MDLEGLTLDCNVSTLRYPFVTLLLSSTLHNRHFFPPTAFLSPPASQRTVPSPSPPLQGQRQGQRPFLGRDSTTNRSPPSTTSALEPTDTSGVIRIESIRPCQWGAPQIQEHKAGNGARTCTAPVCESTNH